MVGKPAVRVVDDLLTGATIVVAGSAPVLFRVVGARNALQYEMEPVDAVWVDAKAHTWPPIVPLDLHRQPSAMLVRGEDLRPVDVLRVGCGSRTLLNADDGYWLWQAALPGDWRLTRLEERVVRRVLASPWLQQARGEAYRGRAISTRLLAE